MGKPARAQITGAAALAVAIAAVALEPLFGWGGAAGQSAGLPYVDATGSHLPAADLDGDGRTDFFFSSRGGVDRLVLGRAEEPY